MDGSGRTMRARAAPYRRQMVEIGLTLMFVVTPRHCEERSDEATSLRRWSWIASLRSQ
jgi:hypothetical protein